MIFQSYVSLPEGTQILQSPITQTDSHIVSNTIKSSDTIWYSNASQFLVEESFIGAEYQNGVQTNILIEW